MERLIVCQGTAQLVTAVAALRQHERRRGRGQESGKWRDHLLICGLAVSEAQVAEFSGVIEQMAALLHSFATISRLSDTKLEQLLGDAGRASNAPRVAALFQQATGIGGVDEVFIVRDWQPCNVLALSAFPDATHVCYGDSVGVYLPRGFMAGKPAIRSRTAAWLRQLVAPPSALLAYPRLDVSYLLLAGAFGVPPSGEVVPTESAVLRYLFGRLRPLLDCALLDSLHKRLAGRPVWVLMGSNFSEQGTMTLEAEIAAYCDWIVGLRPDPGTVLLIKSHPRDRPGKRELLEQHLQDHFSAVWSADSVGSAYLPIEVLLLNLMPIVASLHSLTFSTACLSTHFVVGSTTHIGFGEELVAKYVVPGRRRERRRHELDLRRICAGE
jgi:Alpha-2,8-polysialyltransferase (POLYST)